MLYKLGHLYSLTNEYDKSLAAYERIVALSPHFPEVHLNRGIIFGQMAKAAPDRTTKIELLQKARREYEAHLEAPYFGKTTSAEKALDQVNKELRALNALPDGKKSGAAPAPAPPAAPAGF